MGPKISTVIPVYNAENTIERAINSVLNQKWDGNISEDLEIIVVDDCSKDNSRNIINKLAEDNLNIKPIFLKENSGAPSVPRNIGVENATGEYLIFLDADDLFVDDCFKTVYDIIEKEKVDVVHFNLYNLIGNDLFKFKHIENNKEYRILNSIGEKVYVNWVAYTNIFKTSFIKNNNIIFPPKILGEDVIFALKSYILGDVIVSNYYGYIYVNSSESITRKVNLNTLKMGYDGNEQFLELLREYDLQEFENEFIASKTHLFYFGFLKLNASKEEKINILKEVKAFNDTVDGEIIVPFKPIEMLNKLVKDEKYSLALKFSNILGLVYKYRIINEFVFKIYSNFEKVEVKL